MKMFFVEWNDVISKLPAQDANYRLYSSILSNFGIGTKRFFLTKPTAFSTQPFSLGHLGVQNISWKE